MSLKGRYYGKKYLKIGSWIFSEGSMKVGTFYPFLFFKAEYGKTSVIPYLDSFTTMILSSTGKLRMDFEDYLAKFRHGRMITEIFLGNSVDPERRKLLVRSGIYHFFVVSGLHVGIFSTSIMIFLLILTRNRRISILLSIPLTVIYSLMVGFSLPAMRACIVVSLFMLLDLLDYRQDPFNVLGLAGFVMLFFDPVSVLSWSFHLSFMAAGAYTLVSLLTDGKSNLYKMAISTCISTVAILPLIILYFGIIPLLSIPLSLLLSPVAFPYIIFLSSLSFMSFALKLYFLSSIFIHALEPMMDFLNIVLKIVSKIPHHFVELKNMHFRVLLFSLLSLLAFAVLTKLVGKKYDEGRRIYVR